MSDAVLIALISAGVPTLTTAVTAILQRRISNMHDARHSILQLIMEDHLAVHEGHLPTNYQNILHEFDIYKKNGGNSYVESKISEYKQWFIDQEKKHENSNKK